MHNYTLQLCNVSPNKPYTLAGFEPGSSIPEAEHTRNQNNDPT
jgi:hypothetical protein